MINKFYTYMLVDSREPFTPFYIGLSGTVNRYSGHKWNAVNGNKRYIYNKWRKIERTGGTVELVKIEEGLSKEEACTKEIRIIKDL